MRYTLSSWLRKAGLLRIFDGFYYLLTMAFNHRRNKRFMQAHTGVAIPDDYSLFETYRLDYQHYYYDGKKTAEGILQRLEEFISPAGSRILEWGCGPARLVRHLPTLAKNAEIHGCDYNDETIKWCSSHIPDVHFKRNGLTPPLPYEEKQFDIVYAISVFTHLSADKHFEWMNEIARVTKPGGYFLFTTQGESFLQRLTHVEKMIFQKNQPVERHHAKEGHRLFSTFQPPEFMRNVFLKDWELAKFSPGAKGQGVQDIWIIRRKNSLRPE